MATRIVAASFLVISALVAWLTITNPFAARLLQVLIVVSIGYVGWLAWHGARVIRGVLEEAAGREPTGGAAGLPFVSIVLPARNEEAVIGAAVASLGSGAVVRSSSVVHLQLAFMSEILIGSAPLLSTLMVAVTD